MTRHLFASALFAGLAAGLVAAALQLWLIVPLILEAETYETGAARHFVEGAVQSAMLTPALGWDWARHGMTLAMNLIAFTAFALLMVAGFALARRSDRGFMVGGLTMRGQSVRAQSVRGGAIWGLAGFAAFALAPSIGLPPELPGTIAAEIVPRQLWWAATVACTLGGLALIGFGRGAVALIAGLVVIVLPHLVGAPRIDTYFGVAPPELASLFVARSLAVSGASWTVLGVVAAWFWTRGAGAGAQQAA